MKTKVFLRSIYFSLKLACTSDFKLGKDMATAPVKVIISLTSIPSRLSTLHLTIKSLLIQNVSFDKIILWLHYDLKESVPSALNNLQGEHFGIHYSSTTEPHRKLVETLKLLPDRYIVTCDDDMIYPKDWLSRLLESWQRAPDDIVAHMCRKMRLENREFMPYRKWRGESKGESSPLTLALGWGGVLYPPGSLDARVLERDTYMRLSPHADDLWFKAMAMLKGTAVRKSVNPDPEPVPIIGSQSISLGKKNIAEDMNREQLLALIEEYKLKF